MGLLSSNKDKHEDFDKKEYVEVEKEETKTAEYTEHVAEIHYPNGDVEEITFDAMLHKDNYIILKNYTGYNPKPHSPYSGGFTSEAVMTLPYRNFRKLETVERRNKEIDYTVTRKVRKKRSEVEKQ